jgi:hypothetical protein
MELRMPLSLYLDEVLIRLDNNIHQTIDFGDIDILDEDGEPTIEFIALSERQSEVWIEMDRRGIPHH